MGCLNAFLLRGIGMAWRRRVHENYCIMTTRHRQVFRYVLTSYWQFAKQTCSWHASLNNEQDRRVSDYYTPYQYTSGTSTGILLNNLRWRLQRHLHDWCYVRMPNTIRHEVPKETTTNREWTIHEMNYSHRWTIHEMNYSWGIEHLIQWHSRTSTRLASDECKPCLTF